MSFYGNSTTSSSLQTRVSALQEYVSDYAESASKGLGIGGTRELLDSLTNTLERQAAHIAKLQSDLHNSTTGNGGPIVLSVSESITV
jgi:hypothetical protein